MSMTKFSELDLEHQVAERLYAGAAAVARNRASHRRKQNDVSQHIRKAGAAGGASISTPVSYTPPRSSSARWRFGAPAAVSPWRSEITRRERAGRGQRSMLFNLEEDSGDRVVGYVVPDGFSGVPSIWICRKI